MRHAARAHACHSMVKNYVRRGSHGGSRRNAGLPPGFWEEQGGRQAAAEKMKKRKVEDAASRQHSLQQAKQRWLQWSAADQQSAMEQPAAGDKAATVAAAAESPAPAEQPQPQQPHAMRAESASALSLHSSRTEQLHRTMHNAFHSADSMQAQLVAAIQTCDLSKVLGLR